MLVPSVTIHIHKHAYIFTCFQRMYMHGYRCACTHKNIAFVDKRLHLHNMINILKIFDLLPLFAVSFLNICRPIPSHLMISLSLSKNYFSFFTCLGWHKHMITHLLIIYFADLNGKWRTAFESTHLTS